ncbi:spore protease YyaC [Evansella halocellulosilytica]|uniref:spore protease YyaC n=1 Tax=Evansella halocellulosilytica TaxID=2011013 RepID=UPI00211C4A9C|nr:spore protease YyaC [Evansella halocellulosilytica]
MMLSGQLFPQSKKNSSRYHMDDLTSISKMAKNIAAYLPTDDRKIIVVCIGTDRSTGDSLGPLVGTKINERFQHDINVYGTLQDPVHAKNLAETLDHIRANDPDSFIIGVDACLGRSTSVGMMTVGEGPVRPGIAVKKQLPAVGDIHITGIVNVSGFMEMMVLQNTRLSLVMKMADMISRSIVYSTRLRNINEKDSRTSIN